VLQGPKDSVRLHLAIASSDFGRHEVVRYLEGIGCASQFTAFPTFRKTSMQPWVTLDRAPTAEGDLVLQQRGKEFAIAVGGRIVMSSHAHLSEVELATLTCEPLVHADAPTVVIAGLGMGFTLRAALDLLPKAAAVTVVELTPAVVAWCRGSLAFLTGGALEDPRVTTITGDVFTVLRKTTGLSGVALDLWQGPMARNDPVFTAAALKTCRRALVPGGRLGIWSEQSVGGFEARLTAAGFTAPAKHVARRGFRHVVYVASVPDITRQ
jgi:spermidine synthase